VFQSYALYPQMKVYDNIAFGLQVRKEPTAEIDRKVREAADILDLGPYLDRFPRALSGGQRQRVAMGRALVRHPKVFLFDEPLSNLDAKLRAQMRLEIRRIHDRLDTTTVYVTHDQIEAMTMADDIVVMRGGAIEQMGSPETVYDEPANCFVADFIGSPAINFLDGTVARHGANGASVHVGDRVLPLPDGSEARDAQKVRVGIRPLDIDVVPGASGVDGAGGTGSPDGTGSTGGRANRSGDVGSLDGEIEFVENTGAESHVHVAVAGTTVRAVSPERLHARQGARIGLRVAPAKIHLFDADSEQRIGTRS